MLGKGDDENNKGPDHKLWQKLDAKYEETRTDIASVSVNSGFIKFIFERVTQVRFFLELIAIIAIATIAIQNDGITVAVVSMVCITLIILMHLFRSASQEGAKRNNNGSKDPGESSDKS